MAVCRGGFNGSQNMSRHIAGVWVRVLSTDQSSTKKRRNKSLCDESRSIVSWRKRRKESPVDGLLHAENSFYTTTAVKQTINQTHTRCMCCATIKSSAITVKCECDDDECGTSVVWHVYLLWFYELSLVSIYCFLIILRYALKEGTCKFCQLSIRKRQ